jgi:hypothetical protein
LCVDLDKLWELRSKTANRVCKIHVVCWAFAKDDGFISCVKILIKKKLSVDQFLSGQLLLLWLGGVLPVIGINAIYIAEHSVLFVYGAFALLNGPAGGKAIMLKRSCCDQFVHHRARVATVFCPHVDFLVDNEPSHFLSGRPVFHVGLRFVDLEPAMLDQPLQLLSCQPAVRIVF